MINRSKIKIYIFSRQLNRGLDLVHIALDENIEERGRTIARHSLKDATKE